MNEFASSLQAPCGFPSGRSLGCVTAKLENSADIFYAGAKVQPDSIDKRDGCQWEIYGLPNDFAFPAQAWLGAFKIREREGTFSQKFHLAIGNQ